MPARRVRRWCPRRHRRRLYSSSLSSCPPSPPRRRPALQPLPTRRDGMEWPLSSARVVAFLSSVEPTLDRSVAAPPRGGRASHPLVDQLGERVGRDHEVTPLVVEV